MGDHFEKQVLADAREVDVRGALAASKGKYSADGGTVFVMWSGHGIPDGSGVRLLVGDSSNDIASGFDPVSVASSCVLTGAHQILCVLDTCHSGSALGISIKVDDLFTSHGTASESTWVGVLTSCAANETAREQTLGPALADLLTSGPDPAGKHAEILRRRWNIHSEFIRGDDLCDALIKQWDDSSHGTLPHFATAGSALPTFKNPLWSPAASAMIMQEIIDGTAVRHFTGRTAEVGMVQSWVNQSETGIFVITGSPGCGKSALLAYSLIKHGQPDGADDGSLQIAQTPYAYVSAIGLNHNAIAERIDEQLTASGVLEPLSNPRNAFELIGALERTTLSAPPLNGPHIPVIGVDGLDETPSQLTNVIDRLLSPLSDFATILVTTRRSTVSTKAGQLTGDRGRISDPDSTPTSVPLDITDVLTSQDRVLDLNETHHRASGWASLTQSVVDRLSDVAETMNASDVADELRRIGGEQNPPPYLLAELVCDHLAEAPIDTSKRGWEALLATSVDDSLDGIVVEQSVSDPNPLSERPVEDANHLFAALQWGLGAGFPEPEWIAVANGTSQTREFVRDDIDWLLSAFGKYVVEDSEHGTAVYRCAHPFIADHFRFKALIDHEPGEVELQVARVLIGEASTSEAIPGVQTQTHLGRYLGHYIMRAGGPGLDMVRDYPRVIREQPGLLEYLTLGSSINALGSGDVKRATELAQQTVSMLRDKTDNEDPRPLFGQAHAHLALCLQADGQIDRALEASGIAVRTYENLIRENRELLPDYAAVVHNYATTLMDAGQATAAVRVAERVVDLEREFVDRGGNESHFRLGITLNVLALAYSAAGRDSDAVGSSRQSVDSLRRVLELRNRVRDRLALADSLSNLGSHLAATGDLRVGLSVTEEAFLLVDQATQGSIPAAKLAGLKNDYANRLYELGDAERALQLTSEAISTLQAAERPSLSERAQLLGALNNYCAILLNLGEVSAAAEQGAEAIKLARRVTGLNPMLVGNLAMILDNHANCLSRLSQHRSAIEHTEEALVIYRRAADLGDGYLADLARVLVNYADRLAHVNRADEAVASAGEARDLYTSLARANSRYEVDVARTVAQLAVLELAAHNRDVAAMTAIEAVRLCDELARSNRVDEVLVADLLIYVLVQATGCIENLALQLEFSERVVSVFESTGRVMSSDYATALRNLAAVHGMRQEFETGADISRQAVEILTQLSNTDRAFEVELASALGTHARLQFAVPQQRAGALDSAFRALNRYERIPELTPANIDTCGEVLAFLATEAINVDPQLPIPAYVDRMMERLDGVQRALLAGALARRLPDLSPFVPTWINRGLDNLGELDPQLKFGLRALARRKRSSAPISFDAIWTQDTDALPPFWLTVNRDLLRSAMQWGSSDTHSEGREYLLHHPYLLEPAFDAIVEEAYLGIVPERVVALRAIRTAAAEHGIDAAYQDPIASDIAEIFVASDLDMQLELLGTDGEQLRSPNVLQQLRVRAEANDKSAQTASFLVRLSEHDLHTAVVEVTHDPDGAQSVLERIVSGYDEPTLARATQLLLNLQSEEAINAEVAAVASFFFSAFLAGKGHLQQARELTQLVSDLAPSRIDPLIAAAIRLGSSHPEFAQLVRLFRESEE
nr:tetratricopeptide repeat protein [Rhodococcus sp. (in: high G+C Gram-positive bacteria)]